MIISCQSTQPVTPETHTRLKEGSHQIHLDFHTAEAINSIGFKFNKKEFQAVLITGNVNSINIFGNGHHSWCYYPTVAGSMHPGLDFDLLGAQIEACHEIGVTAQVYITVGWSANDALNHPEWTIEDASGTNSYRELMKDLGPEDPFGWGWDLLSPEASIYCNWSNHAGTTEALSMFPYEFYAFNTKHDLEDLPTASYLA